MRDGMYQQLNKRAKRGAVDTSHLSLRSLANQNPKNQYLKKLQMRMREQSQAA